MHQMIPLASFGFSLPALVLFYPELLSEPVGQDSRTESKTDKWEHFNVSLHRVHPGRRDSNPHQQTENQVSNPGGVNKETPGLSDPPVEEGDHEGGGRKTAGSRDKKDGDKN